MQLDEPNSAVAASLPAIHPAAASLSTAVGFTALYPAIDPSKTIIAEIKDRGPEPPTEAEEDAMIYRGPPETANAKPATVDTTPPGATDVTVPLEIPSDVTTLAAQIAASGGAVSPAAASAMAASWVARVQAAVATPPPPVAAPVEVPVPVGGAGADSTSDRKLLQATFNFRQDILMMYTEYAASTGGGVATLENTIRHRIAETNKAYQDSGVNIDLVMVGVRLVSEV
jgi:hypothetical protein